MTTEPPQTQVFDTGLDDEREQGLSAAATAIRRGGLAVIPTDTVYGVAADAFSPPGVSALLAAKGRGRDMPVPVLVSTPEMLTALVDNLPDVARKLVDALWPGGLTLVVKHTTHLAWDLGETRGTVAVRMPADQLALDLISRTGPLAVSSANRTGHPAATTMMDRRRDLGAVAGAPRRCGDRRRAAQRRTGCGVRAVGSRPWRTRSGALTSTRCKPRIRRSPPSSSTSCIACAAACS
jgi:L-threonylcarbamoyladenylate synthase